MLALTTTYLLKASLLFRFKKMLCSFTFLRVGRYILQNRRHAFLLLILHPKDVCSPRRHLRDCIVAQSVKILREKHAGVELTL